MFVVFSNETFHWYKHICIKKWTYKISARFHSLTEMSRDRNGSDRIGQTETARPKSRIPYHRYIHAFSFKAVQKQKYTMII